MNRRRNLSSSAPDRLGLHDLAKLARAMKKQAEEQRLQALTRQAADRRRQQETEIFAHAVGQVTPLKPTGRREPELRHRLPTAQQRTLDEQQALAQSLSDEIDVERLLESDEKLSFRRPGVGIDALGKLRRGQWVVQAQLDLHGFRTEEAREQVVHFLVQANRNGLRCVRIIHGKGLGSVNRQPVLKDKVLRWLTQRLEVIAFCQAPPFAGGSGALLVLLRQPPSHG
ncbi:MAG: Smr/MutS family protein [Lautropia sp.]|nr:Smr/MutS family protein [Lautropia sp.]